MERPGDEFPERLEVLEHRAIRVVIMRGGVVQIGGEPQRVADTGVFDERQQIGDFQAAAARAVGVLNAGCVDRVADRRVGGDHFPGRLRARQLTFEPGDLLRPEQIIVGPQNGVGMRSIRAAIAAHVEHEHVEQRAVADLAIDAAGLGHGLAHGQEFVKGAAGARGKGERILLAERLLRQRLVRPPRLHHFVVVPQRKARHRGVERAQIVVEQIVFVIAAIIGERFGRFRLLFGDDAAPDAAVGQFLLRDDGAVGINIVAAMDEEVGLIVAHGGVAAHAAACRIDAPALAHRVARPQEGDRAPVFRRRAEMPDLRLTEHRRGQILEAEAIEDVLVRRQVLDQRLCGEIGFRQRVDEHRAPDVAEAVGGRDLDQHARGTVSARPDHAGIDRHVARLHAVSDLRPVRREAQRGPREAADCGDGRRCRRGLQERATGERRATSHCHWASAVATRRKVLADFDEGSNVMRRQDDSVVDLLGIVPSSVNILVEHDLFGKPVSTFPDHALSGSRLGVRGASARGRFQAAFGVVEDRGAARGDGEAQLVERERERHAYRSRRIPRAR